MFDETKPIHAEYENCKTGEVVDQASFDTKAEAYDHGHKLAKALGILILITFVGLPVLVMMWRLP